jgi:8-oxo-dGTP pyrophosphatase MutT (NUDIX family)
VSEVRVAATVILMRPALEVYLTRRSTRSAFAPNAFVFPGGTVEALDASDAARARTRGLDRASVAHEFRAEISPYLESSEPPIDLDTARSLLVAALRELFEEAGVLLARGPSGAPIDVANSEEVAAERERLRSGVASFADVLAALDWYADATALALFSHWITPRSERRRYNTHFFLAAAPLGQAALADAFETHDGLWIAPSEALARHARDELHLVYPTIKHLERLSAFDSVDAALAFARSKPILTIMPKESEDDFELPDELESAW